MILWTVCLAGLAAGCSSGPFARNHLGDGGAPSNSYRAARVFPKEIRRVAVLPVTLADRTVVAESGQASLEPVLHTELRKGGLFELVIVSPAELRAWTGRDDWTAEEGLPHDFFTLLRERAVCDAVLFCRLSEYRPYAPLAVGWNLRLVDCRDRKVWWAVDEVYDAGREAVAGGARRYWADHLQTPGGASDASTMLRSPRRFGQYAVHAALATAPGR